MNTTARTPYSYIVLRYVHDIGTGEFINVGVVMTGARGSYIGAKFKTAYGRVKRRSPPLIRMCSAPECAAFRRRST